MAQMDFFDLSDRYANRDAKKDPLVEIDAVVPWDEFFFRLLNGSGECLTRIASLWGLVFPS